MTARPDDGEPFGWRPAGMFRVLAVLVIGVELFLAVALWIRRTRRVAFVLGLGLHLSVLALMRRHLTALPEVEFVVFGLITLAPYLFFLDWPPRPRVVVWDERCRGCRTWFRWMRRLDWLGIHEFRGSGEEVRLDAPDGHWKGFEAVRRILQMLPSSFLWAPLLDIRAVRRIGEKAFAAGHPGRLATGT